MASIINALTASGGGVAISGDATGNLALQSAGNTAVTINTSQGVQFKNTIGVGDATPSTSGAGITFPTTQSASTDANTLDDYEEGTFTPVYTPGSGSFTTLTYFAQTGKYTKIGNIVYFSINVFTNSVTVGTATGELSIGGLPFTSDSTSQFHQAVSLGRVYRWANAISNMRAYVSINGTSVVFANMATNSASSSNVQVSDMTTGANTAYNCLDISGCYKIA
jgi:hypothetical protein